MGIFSKLNELRRTAARSMARRSVVLSGNQENVVYVYVPRPLRNIKRGDEFTLTCCDGDVTLESTVTGMIWNSAEDGDVPVEYNGEKIGFISGYGMRSAIRKLQDAGVKVSVTAKCTAEGKKRGWPTIIATTPDVKEIEEMAQMERETNEATYRQRTRNRM